MIYYPKNILLFTVFIVSTITTSIAINVQNMNDFQRSRLEAREFPGENVLNGESKLQPHTLDEEMLGRIEVQLMGAMEMLQNYKGHSLKTKNNLEKKNRKLKSQQKLS
ncbi:FMRFamide-like peptide 12 [Meloidogyne graminicola]|uniref:FMRFamide-like peptide 12 n=1 Tax=Meloidogyne graminicola TaxID=189291 RepID=A0A8S9ZHP0_9BILA|nr:FMRFamide-like peptide 12 [Meloidogyne graminicola]